MKKEEADRCAAMLQLQSSCDLSEVITTIYAQRYKSCRRHCTLTRWQQLGGVFRTRKPASITALLLLCCSPPLLFGIFATSNSRWLESSEGQP